MAENEYTAKKVILKNNQGEYLIPYVEFPIATETSAGIVQPDNSTISVNNGTITAEGIKTKNAVLKYDWIGTKAEWEAGRADGTILDNWVCYITDDFVQTDTSGTMNYNELENKPTISGIELKGNKELGELGIQSKLTAGENITISEEGVISAISNSNSELPIDVYTKTNLVAGTNIEIVNPTSGDSNTVALWHFENSNIDEVSGLVLNSHNTLNTNAAKFGSGSLYTSMMGTTYSTIPAVTYDKDFTVECWQYKASGGTFYLGFRGEKILNIYVSQNTLHFNGSSNWEDTTTVSLSHYDTGMWHHWALSYVASTRTMHVYLNGIRVASRGIVSDFSITGLVMGSTNGTDLIDELRISNIARYTSDTFELQTEPFTLSSVDTSRSIINNTLSKLSELENDTNFITESVLETKQDKLTAGNGITIENNIISSTATGGSSTFEMDYDEATKTLIFSNGDL